MGALCLVPFSNQWGNSLSCSPIEPAHTVFHVLARWKEKDTSPQYLDYFGSILWRIPTFFYCVFMDKESLLNIVCAVFFCSAILIPAPVAASSHWGEHSRGASERQPNSSVCLSAGAGGGITNTNTVEEILIMDGFHSSFRYYFYLCFLLCFVSSPPVCPFVFPFLLFLRQLCFSHCFFHSFIVHLFVLSVSSSY